MSNSIIRRLLILGVLSIAGILFVQSYLLMRTWNVKMQEFNQTVYIALRNVAEALSDVNGTPLPTENLIQQRSSNVYAVNINSSIDANLLEEYLEQEFINASLFTNFEYAVYDCATDELLYGNYCLLDYQDESKAPTSDDSLPRFEDLIYYFVVKFSAREGYLLASMRQSIIFSLIALLAVSFFVYSIYVILRQKQLTELQKDFINNMTHEFKTPLSSIKLAGDVLAKNPEINGNPRLKRYAQIITDQNARLNSLVEKVLDIAKLEGHQFQLNKEQVTLPDFLEDIVESERLQFEKLEGTLEYIPGEHRFFINADQLHFANVVTNILDNARKYCDGVPHATIKVESDGQESKILFSDNGVGISNDDLKKLFNKFYRVPTGNVHNVKGFGLGLFYVKNICDAHGWKIWIDSKPGAGSTFSLTIPTIIQSDLSQDT